MDGLGINQKIRYGYSKAAQKLGQPFSLYRSLLPDNPIQELNFVGTINAVTTIDWQWMKSNKPGNAIFWLVIDGQASSEPLSAIEGDYLVGDSTYFVLTKEYQMPMSAVQCNAVVNLIRPYQTVEIGNQGYIYYSYADPTTYTSIMISMPISILKYTLGSMAGSKLPTDTSQPSFIILMPNLGGVEILIGDIIIDSEGQNYIILMNEKTKFGWRLAASQQVNTS